jgi:hypothetical protein
MHSYKCRFEMVYCFLRSYFQTQTKKTFLMTLIKGVQIIYQEKLCKQSMLSSLQKFLKFTWISNQFNRSHNKLRLYLNQCLKISPQRPQSQQKNFFEEGF